MNYFEENFVIVVDRNGKMTSVPREPGEIDHYKPFRRLNEQLNGIMGIILETDSSLNLPNRLAKLDYLVIFPFYLVDKIEECDSVVAFPFNPTKQQLLFLKSLYPHLEKQEKVYFFEEPDINEEFEYAELDGPLEELENFVEKKLNQIEKNEQDYSEPGF